MVLNKEILAYVIVEPFPHSSTVDAPKSVPRAYQKNLVDNVRAGWIIHTSMSYEFQKLYKTVDVYSVMWHPREHYNEQESTKRFKVSELLFGSKMEEGTSPVQHALKMYKHIERLDQLGY